MSASLGAFQFVVCGWPQWHCLYLVRFLCGGYNSTSAPVVVCTDGHVNAVGRSVPVVDGHHGAVDPCSCRGWPQWHCPLVR
jgi:hypothetical protein